MLNPAKSEFIWCVSPRRAHLIDRSDFVLKDGTVAGSTVVRNLGAFFYEFMTMTDYVNRLVRFCFYQLRRIKSILRSLPTCTAIQLVNSFVISRVDYCNSLLAGLPKYQLDRIESVLNVAARLIFGRGRYEHVTPLLRDRLHWLSVPQRVEFKRCLLVYEALHGLAPAYITEYCVNINTMSVDRVLDLSHRTVWWFLDPPKRSGLQNVPFREWSKSVELIAGQRKEFYLGWCFEIMTKNIPIWILIYLVTTIDLLYVKAPLLSVPAVFTALYKSTCNINNNITIIIIIIIIITIMVVGVCRFRLISIIN